MINKKYKVEGMHCSSCAMLIDGDLEDTEGVISASTNFAKGELDVSFDDGKLDDKKITEIVNKLGYKLVA